jgi:hypothetical protein
MVLAARLGPCAGTLALALHTSGVLGRLFAEALENTPSAPAEVLVESGAVPAMAFLYGTLPGVLPQLVAYTPYRWEINIRMAAILGFVRRRRVGTNALLRVVALSPGRGLYRAHCHAGPRGPGRRRECGARVRADTCLCLAPHASQVRKPTNISVRWGR